MGKTMKTCIQIIRTLIVITCLGIAQSNASALNQTTEKADMIVFSCNRPLQLFAFLESTEAYIKNVGDIFILYLSSNEEYETAYKIVKKRFKKVTFIRQDTATAHQNFKPHLCDIVENKLKNDHVIFGVDDIVVCDDIDLDDCVKHLKNNHNTAGFYLRLGRNITKNYMRNDEKVPLPSFKKVGSNALLWQFKGAKLPWSYPHSVDMTIYKRSYVLPSLKSLDYKAPNTLEGRWDNVQKGRPAYGLCYEHSKIVNLPLNLAQKEYKNPHTGLLSVETLLSLFQAGLKMDINDLHNINNNSPHMHYVPSFVPNN